MIERLMLHPLDKECILLNPHNYTDSGNTYYNTCQYREQQQQPIIPEWDTVKFVDFKLISFPIPMDMRRDLHKFLHNAQPIKTLHIAIERHISMIKYMDFEHTNKLCLQLCLPARLLLDSVALTQSQLANFICLDLFAQIELVIDHTEINGSIPERIIVK
jgi:hypothetical protein